MDVDRRAVIFDMDGVIVLTDEAHWAAWTATASDHGVEMTRERFLSFNGLTNPDICARLLGDRATPAMTHWHPTPMSPRSFTVYMLRLVKV